MEIKANIQGQFPYKTMQLLLASENEAHTICFSLRDIDKLEQLSASIIAAISNRILNDIQTFLNPILPKAAVFLTEFDTIFTHKELHGAYSVQIELYSEAESLINNLRLTLTGQDLQINNIVREVFLPPSMKSNARYGLMTTAITALLQKLYIYIADTLKESAHKSIEYARTTCLEFLKNSIQEVYWEEETTTEERKSPTPPSFGGNLTHVFGWLVKQQLK
jgi:hypothetical protein